MTTATASIGARYRQVTIEAMTESTGSSGRPVETWAPLMTAMMDRLDLTGTERFADANTTTRVETRWTAPYNPQYDPELMNVPKYRRLSFMGQTYDIVRALPIGRQSQIAIETIASAGTSATGAAK
jgi:hypothetical protein